MEQLWPINSLPQVVISPEGIFKYILIQVYVGDQFLGYLLRGDKKYEYHRNNFSALLEDLKKKGFENVEKKARTITAKKKSNGKVYKFVCEGGGRIQHNYKGKKCSVYGYSKTYGKVDHQVARKMISQSHKYDASEIILNQKEY